MNGTRNPTAKIVLIDTSFLLAEASPRDRNHSVARRAMQTLTGLRLVPAPVLPELFYMLKSRVDYATAINTFRRLHTGAFRIEPLTEVDMTRMDEIMTQYADNAFDFVDVSIMALAERLNVSEIYTFDRRDFMAFRPAHRPYLRLLP
mgnify:CR=1 FL=1